MTQNSILRALESLKAGNFRTGADWDSAHEVCQAHEGDPLFDWVHALIHRIEGDDANADYWYRRARKKRHIGSIEDEWQVIRSAAEQD